jgi:hypothetical protein
MITVPEMLVLAAYKLLYLLNLHTFLYPQGRILNLQCVKHENTTNIQSTVKITFK